MPRAMLVLREAMRAEDEANASSSQSARGPASALLRIRLRCNAADEDERPLHTTLPSATWYGGAPLTENCLKSASRGVGQAAPTSKAVRTSLVRRSHTNSQDRAAGMAINRQKTDATAEPALSQIATGDDGQAAPWCAGFRMRACVNAIEWMLRAAFTEVHVHEGWDGSMQQLTGEAAGLGPAVVQMGQHGVQHEQHD